MATRKWTKSHELQVKRILEAMTVEARPFADMSPEAVAARKALPFTQWLPTYIPHYVPCPPAPMHLEADRLIWELGCPIFLKWGRMTGKTTRYSRGATLYSVCNKVDRFIIQGGKTEDVAVDQLDFVRMELMHNVRIRADYGQTVLPSGSDEDYIANTVRLLARGTGQTCRSQLHGPSRPTRFNGDDLEDDEIARSKDREEFLWEWLFGDVWGALEGLGTQAAMPLLLNTFGRYSLGAKAAERAKVVDKAGRPVAILKVYGWEDSEGQSRWPERMSTESLRRSEAISGTRLYRKEMLCIDDDSSAKIKPEWINAFSVKDLDTSGMHIRVGVDCSATAKETSDYKAIVVLGRRPNDRNLYCLHAWIRQATAQEMVLELFRVWDRFRPPFISCESNGFQTLLWDLVPLMEDAERRAGRLNMVPVTNTQNKNDKLLAHETTFSQGYVHLDITQGDQRLLRDQWLAVGTGQDHDDGPDGFDLAARAMPPLARPGESNAPYTSGARRTNFGALAA